MGRDEKSQAATGEWWPVTKERICEDEDATNDVAGKADVSTPERLLWCRRLNGRVWPHGHGVRFVELLFNSFRLGLDLTPPGCPLGGQRPSHSAGGGLCGRLDQPGWDLATPTDLSANT